MFSLNFYFQWSATEEDKVVPLKKIPLWSYESQLDLYCVTHDISLSAKKCMQGYFFLFLKAKKFQKCWKERKTCKKWEKKLHLFPHVLRFSVSQMKDFFFTVYGFMFFEDPPQTKIWGPPQFFFLGGGPFSKFFWGDPTPKRGGQKCWGVVIYDQPLAHVG